MKKTIAGLLAIWMLVTTMAAGFAFYSFADVTEYDLTEFPRKTVEVGWGSLGVNKGLDGGKIDMRNSSGKVEVYEKGLVAHAASELTFDVKGKFVTRITALCGVERASNNNALDSASVTFKVLADGVVMYESPVVRDKSGSISIDVTIPGGTKILTLATTSGSDGNTGDHSAWVNPMLYADPSIKDDFSGMTFDVPENVMLAGETMQSVVEAITNGGDPITPDSLTFETGDSKVLTVSDKGVITGVGAGTTTITCKLVFKGQTYTDNVKVTVLPKDSSAKTWDLSSPDGKLKMVLTRDKIGQLSYQVANENGIAVPQGTIGVLTDLCDFTKALMHVSETKVTEHNETYKAISGKRSEVVDHYNEMTVTFEKDIYYFDVILRMYDDGFAYRFTIRAKDGKAVTMVIERETSTYTLPSGATMYSEKITKDEMENRFCYETSYAEYKMNTIKNGYFAFPILYTADKENYVLLSESDLYSQSYTGVVTEAIGDNRLQLLPGPVEGISIVNLSFTSPWRLGIVGNLGDIVESDLVEKLVPRSDEDYSWVEPGVTAWMWLSEGYEGQRDFRTIKKYVDLAAMFNWKYLILDEGWQPNAPAGSGKAYQGVFSWFDDLVEYANEKGVGLIAWVKYIDLNTTERLDFLNELAGYGIKGIKADFFDNENQATLAQMKAIYERCAELKMVVNCHGANKPTGERVQYPHLLNREAVNGEEYGGYSGYNLTVWPYTRGVVGPMDLTPRLNTTGSVTNGAQLAMNILFECGIPCMASSVDEYKASNAKALLMGLPAAWDDIHFIDGEITKYTMLARRSGDRWYAAAIANEAKSKLEMPLDFLDANTIYDAFIFRDGVGRTNLKNEIMHGVTTDDVLKFGLQASGGYSVMFVPTGQKNPTEPEDPTEPGTDTPDVDDPTIDPPVEKPTENKTPGGPSKTVFILGAVAAVIVGGGIGFWFVRRKQEPSKD